MRYAYDMLYDAHKWHPMIKWEACEQQLNSFISSNVFNTKINNTFHCFKLNS